MDGDFLRSVLFKQEGKSRSLAAALVEIFNNTMQVSIRICKIHYNNDFEAY